MSDAILQIDIAFMPSIGLIHVYDQVFNRIFTILYNDNDLDQILGERDFFYIKENEVWIVIGYLHDVIYS